ncbi:MAG TPA: hypothetical protein VK608_12660 [Edaphobacter sp.]|nr:hypothetical protein [Edaphobacter sp.]
MLNEHPKTGQPKRFHSAKEIVVNAFGIFLAAFLVIHPGAENSGTQPQVPTGPVGISVGQPPFGFNVIANSTRRLFATVRNGSTNQVAWTLKSGTATLSSNSGSWVDVTAPAIGTSCSYAKLSNGQYAVSSGTQFTIEAAAVDDRSKVADITFNVCNQAVEVSVVPFYRTLYANQSADVQSLILGAVDQSVQWAITAQPSGGDGKLLDSTSRDTVFTGSVPGRYTLTATSNADPRKSSTAIMYVTGHAMPYKVTPNLTEPVDCTVDPKMLGTVYEVGPTQAFKTLAAVPFPTMVPGSTVRLHNEDTSGLHPTEYHEYVQISQQATAEQPFRMCGVPDSKGNLPILDAANATGRSDTIAGVAGYGLITLRSNFRWSFFPNFAGAGYILVEGVHVRNAKTGYSFVAPDGSTGQWADGSSGLRVSEGHNLAFIGNDVDNCGNGAFSLFIGDGGWGGSTLNVLWEGSHFHRNGAVNSYLSHQLYLQAWGEIVQFNRIDNYQPGASGSNLKSRGIQSIIRYNYFGDGAARQMDLVDVQDATLLMSYESYLSGGSSSVHAIYPQDNYSANRMAAEQEAWNSHYAYGNIYENGTAGVPIHFSEDHSGGEPSRKGSLYWYNNTFHEKVCPECSGQRWTLFDTTSGGGSISPHVEFQTIQAFNNLIWLDNPAKPVFQWNNLSTFIGVAGKNLLPSGWGSNDPAGGPGTGWVTEPFPLAYQNSTNLTSHLTGFTSANLVTATSIPYDPNTWILKGNMAGGTAVPSAICQMPTRFAFLPSLGYAVPRIAAPNVGATDTAAQTTTVMNLAPGTAMYNTRYSNCR